MSEQRYTVGLQSKTIFDMKTELYLFDNKIICELLNAQNSLICEQQATIRKLQDLCGESDGENAKLRLKNKELQEEIKLLKPVNIEQYEQIVQLQEENEQLKNRLNKDL